MGKKTEDRRGKNRGQPMDKKSGKVMKKDVRRPTAAAAVTKKAAAVSEGNEYLMDLGVTQVADPRPNLTGLPYIDVLQNDPRNRWHMELPVSINGASLSFLIDTGSSCNYMNYTTTKALGLINDSCKRYCVPVRTWSGETITEWIELENVPVCLGNGIMFYTDFSVEESKKEDLFSNILSKQTLVRLNVVQTFSDKSTRLYFKPTDKSFRFRGEGRLIYLNADVKRCPLSGPYSIVIDTGAKGEMYLSKECLNRLKLSTQPRRERRLFEIGENTYMSAYIKKNTVPDTDMIMGARFLSKYNCVLDYKERQLYFNLGEKTYVGLLLEVL